MEVSEHVNSGKTKIAVIRPGIHTIDEQFCEYISKNGYDVTLVVPSSSKKIKNHPYQVQYLKSVNFGKLADFPLTLGLFHYLKDQNFDIVQSNEDFQFITWVAAYYSKVHKKPFFLIEEIYKYPRFKMHRFFFKLFQKTMCRFVWKNSSMIICHSNACLKFMEKSISSHAEKSKLVFLPIGVNTKLFYKTKSEQKDSSCLKIISVGRLISHKDYPTLFKSVEHLTKTEKIDLKLTIVGKGELKSELEQQIEAMKLADVIELIDHVDFETLKDHYNENDIFVLSSIREAMGAVVLEAMACGLPVIVSDAGGAPDFVSDGKNGFVFEKGNYLDLADKIYQLNDNNLRKEFAQESTRMIEDTFDWDIVIKKYIQIMKE